MICDSKIFSPKLWNEISKGSAVVEMCHILNFFKSAVYLSIGIAMSAATSTNANASDHIKITKEIFIKSDFPVDPKALVKTKNGGYVVAGDAGIAWATRIDSEGDVKWRYIYSKKSASKINGAAILPDDSVILCGEVHESRKDGDYTLGLITHISKDGTVLSEQSVTTNDGKIRTISSFASCHSVENGVIILGVTAGAYLDEKRSFWFVFIDNKGVISFDKLSPDLGYKNVFNMPSQTIATHSNELLPGSLFANRVSHIDWNGNVKSTRVIPDWSFPIIPLTINNEINLLAIDNKENKSLLYLNEHLEEIKKIKFDFELIEPVRCYFLPNHAIVLFGMKDPGKNSGVSSIEWIGPDLKENEIFNLAPNYLSTIFDATPTGNKGEFVLTRDVFATKHIFGADEKRTGVILTFVQIK